MITKIPKILILLVVSYLPHQFLFSQHTSRDNFTGFWEDSQSWNPSWGIPQELITGYNITIYGYVTANSSLTFYNMATVLTINDTLVINGDLILHNNNDLLINDQGILIVRGNLHFEEHTILTINGSLIITGNVYKENLHNLGSFTSNDIPPKVFIGGSFFPSGITDNFTGYPVINCTSPVTVPYPHSGCSSGNMDDLVEDPLYPFFQSTCHMSALPGNITVCRGDTIRLSASGAINYSWNGPADFTSSLQNPAIAQADSGMSGSYSVHMIADHDCDATDTVHVLVNSLPPVSIVSSDDILCMDDERNLTGLPSGGTFTLENGPGLIKNNLLKPTAPGEIQIRYSYSDVCSNSSGQTITVNPLPDTKITSSADMLCSSGFRILTGNPAGGVFFVDEGPGILHDSILTATGAGEILVKYLYTDVCSNADRQKIVVNPLPEVSITSSNENLCLDDQRTLTGSPSGGSFRVTKGPGFLTDTLLTATDEGEISIQYLYSDICSNSDSQVIIVNARPVVSITSSDDTLCANDQRKLTGSPQGGTFLIEKGPSSVVNNVLQPTGTGEIFIMYSFIGVCSNSARQTIVSVPQPYSFAGTDQELEYHFETRLEGGLEANNKGSWSLISGTGTIKEIHSPETDVTGLSVGKNVFMWTVDNSYCETSSRVTIMVLDLVVPSVFTPNDDGINDKFYIGDGSYRFKITVFNQWGITEYQSNSYVLDWDGSNTKGNRLPPETYFYMMELENGQTRKGTILIVY